MRELESVVSAVDTLVAHTAQAENIGDWIQRHLRNSGEWHIPGLHLHLPQIHPFEIFGLKIDLSITNHVVMLWIAALFLILLFWLAFRTKRVAPSGVGALLEMLVMFIRDQVAIANMGEKQGKRFTPLLVTFFFFILTCNLMGLIPLFSTATGNVNVTLALALVTFLSTQVFGIMESGFIGYYKSLVPHGVPFYLWPLMFVIEIMGLIAKHVALTIRLFANMTAGHIVLFAFLGLIIMFKSFMISPVSIGFGVFVYFLELLVAFIQAYIFTVLSSLFIGMAVHPEH
jgi:F-type H+-transporting ATPase subunit a